MKAKRIKQVDKEIKALASRILMIANDRLVDPILDDISDEVGGLMCKIKIDFSDDQKLADYIYNELHNCLTNQLIKCLLK